MFFILLSVSLILIYYQFDCNLRLKGTLLPIVYWMTMYHLCFELKCFIDWLRGLVCISNCLNFKIIIHSVFQYLIAYLNFTASIKINCISVNFVF